MSRVFSLILCLSLLMIVGCNTTKATAKLAYKGTVLGAKGVYYAGKGTYLVGSIPLRIADKALDVTSGTLLLTYKVLDTAGNIANISKIIAAKSLDAELAALKKLPDVLEIIVDVAN